MVYSFARIGAALGMTVEDVFTQNPVARLSHGADSWATHDPVDGQEGPQSLPSAPLV